MAALPPNTATKSNVGQNTYPMPVRQVCHNLRTCRLAENLRDGAGVDTVNRCALGQAAGRRARLDVLEPHLARPGNRVVWP
jgi:hypothetical protein